MLSVTESTSGPVLDEEALAVDRRLLARGELPVRRADLPAGQPAAAGAAARPSTSSRGCSATGARRPGLNFIYAHCNRVIRERDLDAIYVTGPGHGGPGARREHLARGHLQRGLPARSAQDADGLRRLFRQFSFPGGIPSHVAPETPGSIHEGGELGYCARARVRRGLRQPRPARRAASSATARRRPGRSPRAGTRTSSSTRHATARCCRSCTSTATRSRTRRCSRGSRDDGADRAARAATATAVLRRRATTRTPCTSAWPPTLDEVARRDRGDPARGAARAPARAAALADDRAAHAEGLDRARRRSTASRSRARGARTRCRWRDVARRTPSTSPLLEEWMRSYRPEELFDDDGRAASPSSRRSRRRATGAWAPTRTPTAACCCATCELPDFRDYAVDVPSAGAHDERGDPGPRRRSCATSSADNARPTSASSARTRPRRTGSTRSSRRPTAPGWRSADPATTTSRPTAA